MFYNIFHVNLSSNTFLTTYYQSPRYPVNLQQTLGKSEHFYEKKISWYTRRCRIFSIFFLMHFWPSYAPRNITSCSFIKCHLLFIILIIFKSFLLFFSNADGMASVTYNPIGLLSLIIGDNALCFLYMTISILYLYVECTIFTFLFLTMIILQI